MRQLLSKILPRNVLWSLKHQIFLRQQFLLTKIRSRFYPFSQLFWRKQNQFWENNFWVTHCPPMITIWASSLIILCHWASVRIKNLRTLLTPIFRANPLIHHQYRHQKLNISNITSQKVSKVFFNNKPLLDSNCEIIRMPSHI